MGWLYTYVELIQVTVAVKEESKGTEGFRFGFRRAIVFIFLGPCFQASNPLSTKSNKQKITCAAFVPIRSW